MTSSDLLMLIVAVLVVLLIIWFVRSRGNTAGRHIDTSMTAIGAATEAVEDLVEDLTHSARAEEKAPDVASEAAANAAIMASSGTVTGGSVEAGVPVTPEPVVTETVVHEPVPMAAPVAPEIVTTPAAAAPPASTGADNLRQIKGVGPKVATLLQSLGITSFAQIAAWTPDDVARVDTQLEGFRGRIVRDNWVEQAGYLARGDTAGFEAKFGKLGG